MCVCVCVCVCVCFVKEGYKMTNTTGRNRMYKRRNSQRYTRVNPFLDWIPKTFPRNKAAEPEWKWTVILKFTPLSWEEKENMD